MLRQNIPESKLYPTYVYMYEWEQVQQSHNILKQYSVTLSNNGLFSTTFPFAHDQQPILAPGNHRANIMSLARVRSVITVVTSKLTCITTEEIYPEKSRTSCYPRNPCYTVHRREINLKPPQQGGRYDTCFEHGSGQGRKTRGFESSDERITRRCIMELIHQRLVLFLSHRTAARAGL